MTRFLPSLLLVATLGLASPLLAQDAPVSASEVAQKSALTQFVQDRLSTPERQIRLSEINGLLSSEASIDTITISDQDGIWLRVNGARIDWNQAALFLGRLEVRSLAADSIEFIRNPSPPETSLPSPEAGTGSIEVPEFPVAIILEALNVPSVRFGESVFGLGSEISLAGSLVLEGGSLDADLTIQRLDGPGGSLSASVDYKNADDTIDLSLSLREPENGILANLLNLEGRPDITLALAGSGPVRDLRADLRFDAGDVRALEGTGLIVQSAEGIRISADLGGPVATLLPEEFQAFFGAWTALTAEALLRSEGGISIPRFAISGGQLALEGQLETSSDNFLQSLELSGTIRDAVGNKVVLPVPGGDTLVSDAALDVRFGTGSSEDWSGGLVFNGFETPDFSATTVSLALSGVAANLADPDARRITFNGDGALDGISASSAEIQAALGDSIGLGLAGLWNSGEPVQLAQLRIVGESLTLGLAGTISENAFNGDVEIQAGSIAPFSGMAGRELGGALQLAVQGSIAPLSGGFDLTLDGTGTNLSVEDTMADRLLRGDVRLSGRVARGENGLRAENFRLENPQVSLTADGSFATGMADFDFGLELSDLALIDPRATGRLSVSGSAQGQEGPIALSLIADLPSGALSGRSLRDGRVTLAGTINGDALEGTVAGAAFLGGHRVSLDAALSSGPEGQHLQGLRFETAGTRLTGDVAQDMAGLLTGTLTLDATDLSTAAALALIDARGAAQARIALGAADGLQNATIEAQISGFSTAGARIGQASLEASIADLFGVPRIQGSARGASISAAGVDIVRLEAEADRSGDVTAFSGSASLATGTDLSLSGSLAAQGEGYRLALDQAELSQDLLRARLAAPTVLAVNGSEVSMDGLRIDVGGGRITATGTAGAALDIALRLESLPLSIANAISPSLGLSGTLNGEARITGSGANPQARFSLTGSGIGAASIVEFGIAPIGFSAEGAFADGVVRLSSAQASGSGGLTLAASGAVPLSGNGLSLTLSGSAPLSLANRFLAARGGQASGTLQLNAQVTGSLSRPQISGGVSTSGAEYIDPELNLRLLDISGRASLSGNAVSIDSLSARLATGGSISAGGTVGLTAPYPADLALRLQSARYADGNLLVATVSGSLGISGGLLASPQVTGDILVEGANITIPENFGGGAGLIDVEHRNLPADVAQTLERASIDEAGAPVPQSRPNVVGLDVMVRAPNQIFIRGRGLDAEVGGQVRLTGPISNIQPVGGFSLLRGRLAILGQRVTFEEGEVTLIGDLDPYLNFVARTQGDDITVFVTVAGRASAPEISFSSNPTLPQDEVLARLLFKRSTGDLSPLQLAQLAGTAAELAGGSSSSLLDSLRGATGLSDLEVTTDAEGNVGVSAGSYVQDNVYVGVEAGANGRTQVNIDLDITDYLTARGSAGANGETSLGVFYEQDF